MMRLAWLWAVGAIVVLGSTTASRLCAAQVDGYIECDGQPIRFDSALARWSPKTKALTLLLFQQPPDDRTIAYWHERTESFDGAEPDGIIQPDASLTFDINADAPTAEDGAVTSYVIWVKCSGGQRGYSGALSGSRPPQFHAKLSDGGPFVVHVERKADGEEWNLSSKGVLIVPPPTNKAVEEFRPLPYRTKQDLARALVNAIHLGRADLLWTTVHPDCLSKMSIANRRRLDEQFARYVGDRISVYDWTFTRVRSVEPSLHAEYVVRPTEILAINFDRAPNDNVTLEFLLAQTGDSWYQVVGEPKGELVK